VQDAERIFHEIGEAIKLVITDVVMPDGGGMALVATLMKIKPEVKVLFVSGYTDGKVPDVYLKGDHPRFLAKPFQPADLALKVRQVLDQEAVLPTQSR
jgi:DNA-binding NtrC family response regulator